MTDERPKWPTPEHAQRVVRELAAMLEPYAAGEEGNRDVVGRVRRLLAERDAAKAQAWNDGLEEAARTLETVFDQPTMASEIRAKKIKP